MRRMLLLLTFVVATTFASNQYVQAITITHSLSQDIVGGYSVTCNSGGVPVENSFYRSFDLLSFGITSDFLIEGVDIGIEQAEPTGIDYPAEIKFYTDTNGGAPFLADLIFLNTIPALVSGGTSLSILSFPASSLVSAGSTLVVEFFMPDATTYSASVFPGSNPGGQTGPTYFRAPDCGLTEITNVATVGFPDMHLVMNVTGSTPVPEPSAMFLVGLGLLGLIGIKARKKS